LRPPIAASTWAALGAATVAAAALRLPFLANQSLWYDETFTLSAIAADSLGELWRSLEATESTPPLYYLLVWGWTNLVGTDSDAALRTVGAVAGVLSVPAAFAAARRLAGDRGALAVAALCATSPVLVAYALDARAYSLLVLVGALSVWALAGVLERPSPRRLGLWAAIGAACVWTHYFGGFLILGEIGVMLWRLPEARVRVAAAGGAVAVAFAPLVALLADQRGERSSQIGEYELGDRLEQTVRQLAAGPNPPSALLEGAAIALAAGGLIAAALAGRRSGVDRAVPALLAVVAIGIPLALALTEVEDRFFMRNTLGAWVCLAVLASIGLVRLRAAPLAAAVAVSVAIVVWVHADWHYQKADWKGALEVLGNRVEGRPVVVYPGFDQAVANAYLDRFPAGAAPPATEAWVLVEPGRANRRDLVPVEGFPRRDPPGFRRVEARGHDGFRILLYRAPRPIPIDASALGPDVLNGRPVILPP
jgi:mannosyltransferase